LTVKLSKLRSFDRQ